jgi:elongation factor P
MESVETVDVASIEMQYLYKDDEFMYFMNQQDFEQYQVPAKVAEDYSQYLKEGEMCYVYIYQDTPLNMRLPASVELKVVETEDAIKGDTVQGGKKAATLESGAVVQVPLFIKNGEIIIVNPDSGEYVGRA